MDRESSHTILNELVKLRIMHDLLAEKNFEKISQQEIEQDVLRSLEILKDAFLSTDQ